MSRAVIWALVGVGILFLLIKSFIGSASLALLGILLIGGGFYLGLRPGGILRKEQVVDRWGILIENGHGKANLEYSDVAFEISRDEAAKKKEIQVALRAMFRLRKEKPDKDLKVKIASIYELKESKFKDWFEVRRK